MCNTKTENVAKPLLIILVPLARRIKERIQMLIRKRQILHF